MESIIFIVMKDKIVKRIPVFLFVVWCIVWTMGLAKDVKRHYQETAILFGKSLEQKWEYVFGEDLYKYLSESKRIIPDFEPVTFLNNLDYYRKIRAIYFLFPHDIVSDAEFIMVYHYPFLKDNNQKIIFKHDEDSYIIKK